MSAAASPIHDLTAVVHECVRLAERRHIPADDGVHLAATLSHQMMRALADCERAGWSPAQIAEAVKPARDVHGASPFVKRLQDWPRGYPGDFETVEYILDQQNRAAPDTFAWWIEQYALDSPIAQQHRNKVRLQARAILDTALERRHDAGGARVLVLASGGAADVGMMQAELADLPAHLVLVDQDADALTFASTRLRTLGPNVTLVCRNVVRGLASVRALGPFDLVLAGGLFDYLPDAIATSVLRYARERLLAPDGRVVFTNIGAANPYRRWIEYLGNWRLLHRSPAEVLRLCADSGYEASDVTVTREQTGLALVVDCAGGDVLDRRELSAPAPAVAATL